MANSGGIKKRAGQFFFCSFSRKDANPANSRSTRKNFFSCQLFPLYLFYGLVVQVIDCASVTVLLLLGGNAAGIHSFVSLHFVFLKFFFYRHDALICKMVLQIIPSVEAIEF